MRSHFEFCPKTVNIQGYSELREPIRMHKNYYPPIWWILRKAMHSSWKKSVIIIYTSQNIKPLHHAVAAQWTPLLGILFEEVLVPTIKDHEHYARTDNISGLSEVVMTIPFSAQIGLLHLKSVPPGWGLEEIWSACRVSMHVRGLANRSVDQTEHCSDSYENECILFGCFIPCNKCSNYTAIPVRIFSRLLQCSPLS